MAELSLEEFGQDIWTVSAPLKLAGSHFGTRMTVVRLVGGGLVLISPCPMDDVLAAKLEELGEVKAVIAPNAFHHLYLLGSVKRFPEAVPFLAAGVAKKIRAAPPNSMPLTGEADPMWESSLEQCLIGGLPTLSEVVFFHPTSRTLVLTDFCFNFNPPPAGWTGIVLRLAGAHGKFCMSRLMRSLMKDRKAAAASVDQIRSWDFDRIIVTHGQNVLSHGKQEFEKAMADL